MLLQVPIHNVRIALEAIYLEDFDDDDVYREIFRQLDEIFDARLKERFAELDSKPFIIKRIDSVAFFSAKEQIDIPQRNLTKITDIEQARQLLGEQVVWASFNEESRRIEKDEQGDIVYRVVFRDGTVSEYVDYFGFFAFFPQIDVLLLEGTYSSSEVSFNLLTGETTETVGNPTYYLYSPSARFRLNGFFDGHAPHYFIQEQRHEGQYHTIIEALHHEFEIFATFTEFSLSFPKSLYYMIDAFWENDSTLNFIAPFYYSRGRVLEYYRLILR